MPCYWTQALPRRFTSAALPTSRWTRRSPRSQTWTRPWSMIRKMPIYTTAGAMLMPTWDNHKGLLGTSIWRFVITPGSSRHITTVARLIVSWASPPGKQLRTTPKPYASEAPNDSGAYFQRGNAYRMMGQPQQAAEEYETAIRLNPQSAEAYNGQPQRGKAYSDMSQFRRAIQDFDQAINLNPNYAEDMSHTTIVPRPTSPLGSPSGPSTTTPRRSGLMLNMLKPIMAEEVPTITLTSHKGRSRTATTLSSWIRYWWKHITTEVMPTGR